SMLGLAIGPLTGGLLARNLGLRWPFLANGAALFLLGLLIGRSLWRRPAAAAGPSL
ncbi:MAG: MFS transporter, partial [Planctomycetes bacterium]|nr:MFS transporter [Planctomycetota bacterium]